MKQSTYLAALSTILLAACGGGSSSNTSAPSVVVAANPFKGIEATYVIACTANDVSESGQGTITITTTPNSSEATVKIHSQDYKGSTNCAASSLDKDLTVDGRLKDKAGTKDYKDASGKAIATKLATFSYTGLTLSKGNLIGISLPVAGASTDIAYTLVGTNLYVSKGVRGSDGLGDSLSGAAVKQ